MDEFFREYLIDKLKKLGIGQEDIDKAILDYDSLAAKVDDSTRLSDLTDMLIENAMTKNNITENPDGSTSQTIESSYKDDLGIEYGVTQEINKDVPLEDFKVMFGGNPYETPMPEIFDDIKGKGIYERTQFHLWSMNLEYQNRPRFLKWSMQQYEIAFDFAKSLPSKEDKKALLELMSNRLLGFDDEYSKITVRPEVDLSADELSTMDNLIDLDTKNLKNQLPDMLENFKGLDTKIPANRTKIADIMKDIYAIEPNPESIARDARNEFLDKVKEITVDSEQTRKIIEEYDSTAKYLDDPRALKRLGGELLTRLEYQLGIIPSSPYDDNNVIPSVTDDEIEMATEDFKNEETSRADNPFTESEDGVRLEGELVDEINPTDKEFQGIMNNELNTHWWRYDDSWDDVDKDFMERYASGDLTEQELADMKASEEADKMVDDKIAKAREQYDNEINDAAKKLGITDTKAWSMLIKAGTKILTAIDEEILYSPFLLAEKGLKKLGLGMAGTAVGGLTRAAIAYEDVLFKANLGIAALAHGQEAISSGASRLPGEIANGILNLYGAGMPEGLAPEVETGVSKEEQAKRQQQMFNNQMYQYSRMSPTFRVFTDYIAPATGIADPIDFYSQAMDRVGNMFKGKK